MSRKQANSRELACDYRDASCRYTYAHGIANPYTRGHCHANRARAEHANTKANADRTTS